MRGSPVPHRRRLPSRLVAALAASALVFPGPALAHFNGTVSLSKSSGPPGTSVTVSGSGYPSGSVEIRWDTTSGVLLGTTSAAGGTFSKSVKVPDNATIGQHYVVACSTASRACSENDEFHFIGRASFQVTAPPTTPSPGPTSPSPEPTSPSPSPTESPSPSSEPTPPPIPPISGRQAPARCAGLDAEEKIDLDFEGEEATLNGFTHDGTGYLGGTGIRLDGEGWLRQGPSLVPAHSGSGALHNEGYLGEEFGSADIEVRFTSTGRFWDFARVYVGVAERLDAVEPFTATLTAYTLQQVGKRSERVLLGRYAARLGPAPQAINACLFFEAPGRIWAITVDYGRAFEPELIDDVTFGGVPEGRAIPGDTEAPDVRIDRPAEDQRWPDLHVRVEGSVVEDRELRRIVVEMRERRLATLLPPPEADGRTYRFAALIPAGEFLRGNTYDLIVRATDATGNEGVGQVRFVYAHVPRITLDIAPVRYEVTQGIQCLPSTTELRAGGGSGAGGGGCSSNSVRIYADKPTLVRLYLRALSGPDRGAFSPSVSGEICVDGECEQSLDSVQVQRVDDPVFEHRGDLDRTLNFLLRPEWMRPPSEANAFQYRTLEFTLRVNPGGRDVDECCYDNNELRGVVRVHRKRLDIVMVRVDSASGITATAADRAGVLDGFRIRFPASEVNTWMVDGDPPLRSRGDYTDASGAGCGDGWSGLLDDLEALNEDTENPVGYLRFFGMVPEVTPHGSHGCGEQPGTEAAGVVNADAAHWPDRGDETMSQEIAHNHGRKHAPGCSAPDTDGGYVTGTDASGSAGVPIIGDWGVDLRTMTLIAPDAAYDFMGYCAPMRWVSPYTYRALGDSIRRVLALRAGAVVGLGPHGAGLVRTSAAIAGGTAAEVEYLVGSVFVSAESARVRRAFYRQPVLPDFEIPDGTRGPYVIELIGAGGTVLGSSRLAPRATGDGAAPDAGIARIAVPWRDGTRRIQIRRDGRVLLSIGVSAGRPRVGVISPNGGERWPASGVQTIRWEASDPDGDRLTYKVQYSTDGGKRWRLIATGLTEPQVDVEAADLAGTAGAVLRVWATDGVNTASDVSDGRFEVPRKAPQVSIASPRDGQVFPNGRQVVLEGDASDFEDSRLGSEAYEWSSDRDGRLGTGRILWGEPLRRGRHTITLTVRDSDGMTARASSSIVIVGGLSRVGALAGGITGAAMILALIAAALLRGRPSVR